MPWSSKSPLGKGVEIMPSLKSIDLSYCYGLTKLAHFSRFPNLVDLNLSGCKNLVGVDPSIGFLKNLLSLNLGFCEKLKNFEIMEEMKSLKCLDLRGTAIKEISSSIGHLISLEKLILRECARLTNVSSSIFELQHLRHLDLFWCDSLVTFPTNSGFSTSLQGKHYDPLFVSLDSCTNLKEILEFPREIDGLNVRCCRALKIISKLSNILEGKDSKMIPRTNLYSCNVLCQNLAQMKKSHLRDDSAEAAPLLALFLSCQQSEFEVLYPVDMLPPKEYPSSSEEGPSSAEEDRLYAESGVPVWFSWRNTGENWPAYKLKIEFPGDFNWENRGLAFCAQSYETFKGPYFRFCAIYINGVRIKEPSEKPEEHPWRLSEDHLWLYYIPFHTIIRRLSESGLPPPSMCLVKFEFEVKGESLERAAST
ncbi:PREDICTED: uncharacterized protein LOC101309521 [Fragaria vesca subsp. vesca]